MYLVGKNNIMAGPDKDRSKERMPGVLSNVLDTTSDYQKGNYGNIGYRTDLLNQLGINLISALQGHGSYDDAGRRALEESLFGIRFDISDDSSIGFETGPVYGEGVKPTRDYRVSLTKRF